MKIKLKMQQQKQHKQTCKQTGETFKPVKSVKTIYNRCKLNKDMATNKY